MTTTTPPDVVMALDLGGFESKGWAGLAPTYAPQPFWMPPEVLSLPAALIDDYHARRIVLQALTPQADAWVQWPGSAEPSVVGQLAQQFDAIARLDQLKYEGAIPKTLALVGAIAQQHHLDARFTLAAIVLVPYGELANSQALTTQLAAALKNFQFRGMRYRVRVSFLHLLPEATGIVQLWKELQATPAQQRQPLVALMCGHRNCSLLVYEQGQFRRGFTNAWGFAHFVDLVVQRTAGQSPDTLAPTLCQIDEQVVTASHPRLRALVRSTLPHNQVAEAEQLAAAVNASRLEYWRKLQAWIARRLPTPCHALLLGGGTSLYLMQELEAQFAAATVFWGKECLPTIEQLLRPVQPAGGADVLAFRLLDVYGIYGFIRQRFARQEGA